MTLGLTKPAEGAVGWASTMNTNIDTINTVALSNVLANGNTTGGNSISLNNSGDKISTYSGTATAGMGVPAIYASYRVTGQTTNVTLGTFTVGLSDASFDIGGCITITAATTAGLSLQVSYTNEQGGAQTDNLPLWGGSAFVSATSGLSLAQWLCGLLRIRAKASTTISIKTGGTYTETYNAEGTITQVA